MQVQGVQIIGLAVLYFVAARLSHFTADPPGFAAAIWPAAGIALAVLLLGGRRLWPGVLLGSMLANLMVYYEPATHSELFELLLFCAGIGLGATLQAVAGYWLVKRSVDIESGLIDTPSIINLLVLGGPISCLIGASFAVSSLYLSGITPVEGLFFDWLVRWIGDSLGVLILMPLVFIWFATPRELWEARKIQVALPLLVLVVAVILIFLIERADHEHSIKTDFEEQAEFVSNIIEQTITRDLEVVYSLQSLFNTAEFIDRSEFRRFAERALKRNPGLFALSWNPVVSHARRASFEASMREQGFDNFRFSERNPGGALVPSTQHEFYVPVHYIEPLDDNRKVLGYDVYSNSIRRQALLGAHATREINATAPITLVQETGDQVGVLFFLPVYTYPQGSQFETERADLPTGYVVGVFRIGWLLTAGLRDIAAHDLIVRIIDVGNARDPKLLANYLITNSGLVSNGMDSIATKEAMLWQTDYHFGNRNWRFEMQPSVDYVSASQSLTAWGILVTGLTFASVFGAFLLILSGDALREESRANDLALQIAERKSIEEELKIANDRLEKIARTDELTQIYNRRAIEEMGASLAAEGHRYQTQFSVLMLDIDHFKSVNDRWGHRTGDTVLKEFTDRISEALRDVDEFGRWGGEEFIVLAKYSGLKEAAEFAERLCKMIAGRQIEPVGVVTTSIGVAASRGGESFDNLVLRADHALYAAKDNGRNRVELDQ